MWVLAIIPHCVRILRIRNFGGLQRVAGEDGTEITVHDTYVKDSCGIPLLGGCTPS